MQVAVLDALLLVGQDWGRAGWADLMHEAFYPPGIARATRKDTLDSPPSPPSIPNALEVKQKQSQQKQQVRQQQEEEQRVCTTPEVSMRRVVTNEHCNHSCCTRTFVELLRAV